MYFKVTSLEQFERTVFGADSIVEHLGIDWVTNGINVEEVKSAFANSEPNYYLLTDGKRISDSMFLSEGEILMSGKLHEGEVDEPPKMEARIRDVRYDVKEEQIIVSGSVDGVHRRILSLNKTKAGKWYVFESLANQCSEPDLMLEICNVIKIACELPYGDIKSSMQR